MYISFFFIFSLLITDIYASGKQDDPYAEARELMEKKHLTESLASIVEAAKTQPETFAQGSHLARANLRKRIIFDKKMQELLDVIYSDPDNEKKKLALIHEIYALNLEPDRTTKMLLHNLESSSMFVLDRLQFLAIIKKSEDLRVKGQPSEAAKVLAEGYETFKVKLRESSMTHVARSIIEKKDYHANDAWQVYNNSLDKFLATKDAYIKTIKQGNYAEAEEAHRQFEMVAASILDVSAESFEQGESLRTILKKRIFTDDYINARSAVLFLQRFLTGSETDGSYIGFTDITSQVVLFGIREVNAALNQRGKEIWTDAIEQMDFKNKTSITVLIEQLEQCLQGLEKTVVFLSHYTNVIEHSKTTFEYSQPYIETFREYAQLLLESEPFYIDYLTLKNAPLQFSAAEPTVLHNSIQDKMQALRQRLTTITDAQFFFSKKINPSVLHQEVASSLSVFFNHAYVHLDDLKTRTLLYFISYMDEAGKAALEENQQALQKITQLMQGNSKSGAPPLLEKIAVQVGSIEVLIKQDVSNLLNVQQQLVNTKIDYNQDELLNQHVASINQTINSLNSLLASAQSKSETIRKTIFKVQLAQREAEFRMKSARKNLAKKKFSQARSDIIRAREKINEALALQDDDAYRKKTDAELIAIDTAINTEENKIVVKDVRQYLDNAKKEYFNGNFVTAKTLLLHAEKRWSTTHIEANTEITTWLSIVSNASSVNTGRTISSIEPLYPQMSQLLNNAALLYNEAQQHLKKNQRPEALAKLDDAQKNIRQVLLEYPHNKIAGELTLRIDQLLNPQTFKEKVEKKLQQIESNYKTAPQKNYTELLNLYALEPNFPGIRELRNDIEIYLGIRLNPPDKTMLAKSAAYTREAQKIYNQKNRHLFGIGIQKLDEAIRLNPNNVEAITLKDRMQTALGGQAVSVLSSKDEEKYQQAITELQNGNTLLAAALVEQLLQSDQAKRSSKIIDLKKRIDSQL